ncbi:MAG: acyl-CoA desaturase [Saprospiraceae bacterium]|nr:acyl-CoA desaturase [Saprospiraceae bacterium]
MSQNSVLLDAKENPQFKKVTFEKTSDHNFHKDVRNRVDQYFLSNKISKNANAEMVIKTVIILIGWLGTYFLIISNLVNPWVMLVLALFHGFFTAMVGLNIGHDAIHGSYTNNPRQNKLLGLVFNLIGANDYVWSISHNIVHHTYTNMPHHDEDIHSVPILRMEPTQKLQWIHRFQHIYAFALYGLASLSWVFAKDYVKFFQHQLGAYYRKTFPRKEIVRLFSYKALYYSVFLVIPLIVIELPWYWILFGFLAAHFVEGMVMAIIFMLAHIIEGTEFPQPDADGKINMPWADLQMHTTSNFAINNPLVNYLFGGLNFQAEHHLFPKVCHVHYPKISSIVKQTAKDHNLPYLEQRTFFGAIASHIRTLKKFGSTQPV